MTTLEIINLIEADKKRRKVAPTHALLLEVIRKAEEYYPVCARDIVVAELEELVNQRVISLGDTLNDKYISIL